MFKNLRNKLAVLALVALGLAFGNAWSSQIEKTNGELIYEAIINGQLPDGDGVWKIPSEVTHERKEQKEEKEQKQDSSSTSKWTIRSDGTNTSEQLSAEIQRKIKSAITRLLQNYNVVEYITIHNIASGHMHKEASKEKGEIMADIDKLPLLNAKFAEELLEKKHSVENLVQKYSLAQDDASYLANLLSDEEQFNANIQFYRGTALDLNEYSAFLRQTQAAVSDLALTAKAMLSIVLAKEAKKLNKLQTLLRNSPLEECIGEANNTVEEVSSSKGNTKKFLDDCKAFVAKYEKLKESTQGEHEHIMRKIYETKPKDLQNLQLLEYINRHLLMRLAYLCRFNKSKTQKEDLLGATKQAIGYFLEKDIEIMKNDRGQFALVSGGTKLILTLYKYGDSDHSQVYINHFGPANN